MEDNIIENYEGHILTMVCSDRTEVYGQIKSEILLLVSDLIENLVFDRGMNEIILKGNGFDITADELNKYCDIMIKYIQESDKTMCDKLKDERMSKIHEYLMGSDMERTIVENCVITNNYRRLVVMCDNYFINDKYNEIQRDIIKNDNVELLKKFIMNRQIRRLTIIAIQYDSHKCLKYLLTQQKINDEELIGSMCKNCVMLDSPECYRIIYEIFNNVVSKTIMEHYTLSYEKKSSECIIFFYKIFGIIKDEAISIAIEKNNLELLDISIEKGQEISDEIKYEIVRKYTYDKMKNICDKIEKFPYDICKHCILANNVMKLKYFYGRSYKIYEEYIGLSIIECNDLECMKYIMRKYIKVRGQYISDKIVDIIIRTRKNECVRILYEIGFELTEIQKCKIMVTGDEELIQCLITNSEHTRDEQPEDNVKINTRDSLDISREYNEIRKQRKNKCCVQ